MNAQQLLLFALVLLASAYLLKISLWRTILVLAPSSLRIDAEEPAGQEKLPQALLVYARELEHAGFHSLGTHSERPWLGPATWCFDFARPEDRTFATIFVGKDGFPRVYFLSLLCERPGAEQPAGFAISANFRRAAVDEPGRYISGWLEDLPPERVFRAHQRRLEGMSTGGRFTQEARVAAARAFLVGPGRRELRQEHVQGLLWTLGSLGMVAAAIFGTLRSSR